MGQKVLSKQTQKVLGVIEKGIIDPDTGKVIVFELKTSMTKRWLPILDVQGYDPEAILIQSEGSLLRLEELPRVKNILESGLKVWEAKVFTESGRYLGRVADIVFDEHSGEVVKYYVSRPFFLSPLKAYMILDKKQVLRVERKGLIVKEPEEKVPTEALASN